MISLPEECLHCNLFRADTPDRGVGMSWMLTGDVVPEYRDSIPGYALPCLRDGENRYFD